MWRGYLSTSHFSVALMVPGDPNVMRKRRGSRGKKISILISRAERIVLITSYTQTCSLLVENVGFLPLIIFRCACFNLRDLEIKELKVKIDLFSRKSLRKILQ